MTIFTPEGLRDEIVNDSLSLSYKNSPTPDDWKEDLVIASLINAKNFTQIQQFIESATLKSVIPVGDFIGLGPSEEGYLTWITAGEMVETGNQLVQDAIFKGGTDEIWAPNDEAGVNIVALVTIPASRAENIFIEGIIISAGQVGAAFNTLP